MNHPQWTFAEFWPQRIQTATSRQIDPPPPGTDLAQARDIMRQLGIHGEIDWTKTRANSSSLDFRVARPGNIFEVRADLREKRVTVQRISLNARGITRILHSFTGVRMSDPRNARDWGMTVLWAYCMDALATGLILMVLSSLYLWWSQTQKRWPGLVAPGLGVLSCGFFVFGLRWLF